MSSSTAWAESGIALESIFDIKFVTALRRYLWSMSKKVSKVRNLWFLQRCIS